MRAVGKKTEKGENQLQMVGVGWQWKPRTGHLVFIGGAGHRGDGSSAGKDVGEWIEILFGT